MSIVYIGAPQYHCETLNTCTIKISRFNENYILAHIDFGVLDITMSTYDEEKLKLVSVNFSHFCIKYIL